MRSSRLLVVLFCWSTTIYSQKNQVKQAQFYCAPCGCSNDGKKLDTAGKCSGCGMRLIPFGKFNYQVSSLSSNGMIAYTSNKKNNKDHIYLKKINGSPMEWKPREGYEPQISDDGKNVLYSEGESTLYLYNISTKKQTDLGVIVGMPGIQTAAWAPGGMITFSAGKFPDLRIYIMDPGKQTIDTLVNEPGLRYGAKISPDRKMIAYRCAKGSPPDMQKGIAIYDMIDRQERFVSKIGEYPTWSPDSKHIAFHWPDSSDYCIYTVALDGSGFQKIAGVRGSDCELPIWSPDGKRIYFQTNRRYGNWEIWVMNSDGSEQKPLIW